MTLARSAVRFVPLCLLVAAGCQASAEPARPSPPKRPVTTPSLTPQASTTPSPDELMEQLLKSATRESVEASPLVPDPKGKPDRPSLASPADGKRPAVEFPLAHTSVHAQVTGNLARVEVRQLYQNPSADRLEAVYSFPLPPNAAVTDMMFRIKNRVVLSEVRRRKEAKEVYERAKEEGKTAALTEEERPNLFTQSVANIPPGESVEVVIRYVHEVPFDDGRYLFHFPTTVGPRYLSSAVKDPDRVAPNIVAEGVRSAHDLGLVVELSPADAFSNVVAKSHRILTSVEPESGRRLIAIAPDDAVPNKDFVLSYRPASREPEARLVTEHQKNGDYLMLFVQPPATVDQKMVRAKEMVFLLDKSGSMMGQPIETAKRVIRRALEGMGPDDTFQLIAFDSSTTSMSPEALSNTREHVADAARWLDSLVGSGGTEMFSGISAALDLPIDPTRLRMMIFCTDGFIGDEGRIIEHIDKMRGATRVFGFGIGSSVNRYLIEGVARAGRGAAEFVRTDEPVDEVVTRLYKRLDRPVLTDLAVHFDGLKAHELEPEKLPDLFAGQPLVVVSKYEKEAGSPSVTLTGRLGSLPWQKRIPITIASSPSSSGPILGTLWARRRIESLENRQPYGGPSPPDEEQIVQLALAWKLVTPFTSFVAVERELKVDTRLPLNRLVVPNELPEGVAYAGIFGEPSQATLVPSRVKPGDPEVRIHAPGAQSVEVLLPFDARPIVAVRDGSDGEFVARFLVPSGWPDGRYEAEVHITRADGHRTVERVALTVDTAPAAITVVSSPRTVAPGEAFTMALKPAIPVEELVRLALVTAPSGYAEALKSAIDVKEMLVRAPWGEVVRAELGGAIGCYRATLHAPATVAVGTAALEVVAADTAGNVSRKTIEVSIGAASRAPLWAGAGVLILFGAVLFAARRQRAA